MKNNLLIRILVVTLSVFTSYAAETINKDQLVLQALEKTTGNLDNLYTDLENIANNVKFFRTKLENNKAIYYIQSKDFLRLLSNSYAYKLKRMNLSAKVSIPQVERLVALFIQTKGATALLKDYLKENSKKSRDDDRFLSLISPLAQELNINTAIAIFKYLIDEGVFSKQTLSNVNIQELRDVITYYLIPRDEQNQTLEELNKKVQAL